MSPDVVIDHDEMTDTLIVTIAGRMTHRLEMCPDDAGVMLGWCKDLSFVSLRIENARTLGSRGLAESPCKARAPRVLVESAIAFLASLEEGDRAPDSQAPTWRPPPG